MSRTQKGLLFAILAPTLWGLMSMPIRTLATYGINGRDAAFFRCFFAGIGLFIVNFILNRKALKVDLKGLLLCAIYGCMAYGLSFTAYAYAVQIIPVSVAMVLMFLCPIWVSLMNLAVFKERLKFINSISIAICLLGAVLVSNILSVGGQKISILGIICALYNGFGAAIQLIIPRYFEKSYAKDTFVTYGFLGSAAVIALITDFPKIFAAAATDPVTVVPNILVLSLIFTLCANTMFVKAGGYIDSTLVSILSALEVVVGSLLGLFVYKETMSTAQTAGAIIIVVGALLPNIVPVLKGKIGKL